MSRKDGPPISYNHFPDFIPEGKEMDYPGMGAGGHGMDFQPESLHCVETVEPEPELDTMHRGAVKRRRMRGDATIVPVE